MKRYSMHNQKLSLRKKILRSAFGLLAAFAFLYPLLNAFKDVRDFFAPSYQATPVPDFSAITDVNEKKRAFFAYLLPEIERQNELVMQERLFLLGIRQKLQADEQLTAANQEELEHLAHKYRLESETDQRVLINRLIKRADIIPPALVLVQAANESAWGTSRFARQGYNFFGLWCFKQGCGFVPSRRTEGSNHEVAKFDDLSAAVHSYIRNLNRHYAYQELRSIRESLRDNQQKVTAEALVQGLIRYSERGQDYIDELLDMIRHNRKHMQV